MIRRFLTNLRGAPRPTVTHRTERDALVAIGALSEAASVAAARRSRALDIELKVAGAGAAGMCLLGSFGTSVVPEVTFLSLLGIGGVTLSTEVLMRRSLRSFGTEMTRMAKRAAVALESGDGGPAVVRDWNALRTPRYLGPTKGGPRLHFPTVEVDTKTLLLPYPVQRCPRLSATSIAASVLPLRTACIALSGTACGS